MMTAVDVICLTSLFVYFAKYCDSQYYKTQRFLVERTLHWQKSQKDCLHPQKTASSKDQMTYGSCLYFIYR